jgi:hypothetical protein
MFWLGTVIAVLVVLVAFVGFNFSLPRANDD